MKSDTLQIAIEVDDNGSVKIRRLGQEGEKASRKMRDGFDDTGKSIGEVDRGSKDLSGTMGKLGTTVAGGFANIAAAGAAATAAVATLVVTSANQAKEMENLARLAGTSAEEFAAWSYATESVNISSEQLADISKDVKDKLGDFIATGGGEFADFFEEVAPKVGLTARELQNLSGPEVLVKVKQAMDAANVSAEEQVFYLEAIGNDASKLIPLLEDSGKALGEKAERARELGVALSEVDHQRLLDAKKATTELTGAFSGAKNELAAEFAPVVTEVMELATELIVEYKDEAREIAGIFVNIARSMQGWGAVAGGKLSFLEFARMDAEELHVWLQQNKQGLGEINEQIIELQKQRRKLLTDQGRVLSVAGAEEFKENLADIDKEIAKLTNRKIDWELDEFFGGITAMEEQRRQLEAIDKAVSDDSFFAMAGTIDANSQALDDQAEKAGELKGALDDTEKSTRELYKQIWRVDVALEEWFDDVDAVKEYRRQVESIDDAVSDENFFAVADKIEYELTESELLLQKFYSTFQEGFGLAVGSFLVEQFDFIDGRWKTLWDAMLIKMGEVLTEMVVTWSTSKMAQGFANWDIFHEGVWSLQDDEVPAILQKKEMVIPEVYAEQIRDNLGGFNGSFDSLVAATGSSSDPGGWSTEGEFGGPLGGYVGEAARDMALSVALGGLSGTPVNIGAQAQQFGTGFVNAGIKSAVSEAFGEFGPTQGLGPSSYGKLGNAFGKAAAAMTLGGTPVTPAMASFTGVLGAYTGDLIGDMLDDRGYESLRDAVEDGRLSKAEARAFMAEAKSVGIGHESTLGSMFAGIKSAYDNTVGAMLAWGAAKIEAAQQAAGRAMDDTGMFSQGGFRGLGIGNPGSYGGDNGLGGTFGGGPGADLGAAPGGNRQGGGGYSGAGFGGQGASGGFGDDDGQGATGHGGAGFGGYAGGGVVDRLYVPLGDDGFGGLKYGEGVADLDTMDLLKEFLRGERRSGTAPGGDDIGRLLLAIVKSTQKSAKILERFAYNGMPILES